MQFKRTVLSNGLRVITVPMPSFESVTVLVMVGAGSRYETKKNSGISHFLEHMAFKGTQKRPSAMAISTLIDGIGGEFNAFTGKETTGYYIKSGANHTELLLDVLSDMLLHMLLDKQEIDKERGVILEEINLYEDTPSRKINDIYEYLLYGDTPMGWDIAGEKDIINKISREDFKDYMASLYSADNLTVVVAGGVSNESALNLVQKYFGKMPKFATKGFENVITPQNKPGMLIKHKKTEQAHIAMGYRTCGLENEDRYPLDVLASILGGGMSSRLFHEIREKRGLAYYVRTSSDNYQDVGTLVSIAGVDPKRVDETVRVMRDEYRNITNNQAKITPEELKKAKEFLKGHLVLELEDSRSVAGFFAGQELLEKKIEKPEDVLLKIDAVTQAQIRHVAEKYFTQDSLNLALIGNFEDGKSLQEILEK